MVLESFEQFSLCPYYKRNKKITNLNECIDIIFLKQLNDFKLFENEIEIKGKKLIQNETKLGSVNIMQQAQMATKNFDESIQCYDFIKLNREISQSNELHFDSHFQIEESFDNIEAMIHLVKETWYAFRNNNIIYWINSNKIRYEIQEILRINFLKKYHLCNNELKNIYQLIDSINHENVDQIKKLMENYFIKKCECKNVESNYSSKAIQNPRILQNFSFSSSKMNLNLELNSKSTKALLWMKSNEEITAFKKTFIEFACIIQPNQKEIEPLLKALISMMNLSFEEISNIEQERAKKKEKSKGIFHWW